MSKQVKILDIGVASLMLDHPWQGLFDIKDLLCGFVTHLFEKAGHPIGDQAEVMLRDKEARMMLEAIAGEIIDYAKRMSVKHYGSLKR